MIVCPNCKRDLPPTNFTRDYRTKTGYKKHCKACIKAEWDELIAQLKRDFNLKKRDPGVS